MYNSSINIIGLMSGTSLDGVDICLVSFKKSDNTKFNIVYYKTFEYDKTWVKKIKRICLIK
jgi:anhydro-N-acetylmuramic acid kinase